MKIISKYKDYYDYLTGIYGVDDKIVLDRRSWDGKKNLLYHGRDKVTMCIANRAIDILMTPDGDFMLSDLLDKDEYHKLAYRGGKREPDTVFIDLSINNKLKFDQSYIFKTVIYPTDLNTKFNIPICLVDNHYSNEGARIISSYPILSDYGINKHIPAQAIYLLLTEWLAPKDIVQDTMTDKEKILSRGFDLKTSFRKDKK